EAALRGVPATGRLERRQLGVRLEVEGGALWRADVPDEQDALAPELQEVAHATHRARWLVVHEGDVGMRVDEARQREPSGQRRGLLDRLGRDDAVADPQWPPLALRQDRLGQSPGPAH